MITCDAFIAENCTSASFGRRNLFAANLGRRVFVPAFPYVLDAVFVVLIRSPANTRVEDLSLTLTTSWNATYSHHFGNLPHVDREQAHTIEWSRLDFHVPCEGSFTLDVRFSGFAHSITWSVEAGVGPLRKGPTLLPVSSIVDGREDWNPLTDLVREVRSSLLVADQYATPEFIRALLSPVGNSISCKVITSGAIADKHLADWITLSNDFPRLDIRADRLIHDRFVVRDDEEAYAFGHSLKDLDKRRVSFFSRVYDDEQFRLIREALLESWEHGTVVAPIDSRGRLTSD